MIQSAGESDSELTGSISQQIGCRVQSSNRITHSFSAYKRSLSKVDNGVRGKHGCTFQFLQPNVGREIRDDEVPSHASTVYVRFVDRMDAFTFSS